MSEYILLENNLKLDSEERKTFPRFARTTPVSHRELVEHLKRHVSLHTSDIDAVLIALSEALPEYLAEGRSVSINNIGRFNGTLKWKDGIDDEKDESAKSLRHNARSITFKTVTFTPHRKLVRTAEKKCSIKRAHYKPDVQSMSTPYTKEQRLAKLMEYLQEHHYIKASEYMQLTGLKHTTACTELKAWAKDPNTPIDYTGYGSHRVYVMLQPV
ncbi:MAG: hypothetical protein KBT15_07635 [Bacteroidales bacterium]|nr:hypothetical protein [Candidatus Minthousia equi]